MRVSPMVNEITTQGAGSSARIEVQNVGRAALPYEIKIFRINYDDAGVLSETPADEDFLVFPPQGLIPVGGRQVARVQWVGDPTIDVSHAYFVSIEQLPVALTPGETDSAAAQLQVVYHMKSLLTVAPRGAEPKVEVVSATPVQVSTAPPPPTIDPSLTGGAPVAAPPPAVMAPGLEVRVRNTGKRYALMSGATWIIEGTSVSGEAASVKLTGEQVSAAVGVGYVAPVNGQRTFKVPTGVAFAPDKPIKVRFTR